MKQNEEHLGEKRSHWQVPIPAETKQAHCSPSLPLITTKNITQNETEQFSERLGWEIKTWWKADRYEGCLAPPKTPGLVQGSLHLRRAWCTWPREALLSGAWAGKGCPDGWREREKCLLHFLCPSLVPEAIPALNLSSQEAGSSSHSSRSYHNPHWGPECMQSQEVLSSCGDYTARGAGREAPGSKEYRG